MPELPSALHNIVNKGVAALPPAQIRAFDDEISAIPGIVKLTLGEPDFNVPEHVKQAAIKSIEDNDSHYSASRGDLPLRKAISKYLERTRHVEYDPASELIVTIGATEAITATTFALFNPGDKVIVPTPTFSLYFPAISLTGAEPLKVDTSEDGFLLTPERLEQLIAKYGDSIKAVLLNYPNNPTGRCYSQSELQALAAVLKKHQLLGIVDEIYSDLIYDQPFYSLAEALPDQTILISGLSKSHAMTGWRLGYVAAPQQLINQISKMHSFMVTAPNDTAQAAALEAFEHGQDDPIEFRSHYQKRRDKLAAALKDMGFQIAVPDGAFYIFAEIPAEYGDDDFKFARDLAHQAKVGVIPGHAFGPGGEGHIRLSYAASDDDIDQVIARLRPFMAQFN